MRYINLDMDGVVADFNAWCSDFLGRPISWEGKDLSDEEWTALAKESNIYAKLPLIPESVELVLMAKKAARDFNMGLRFLTAIPRRTTMPEAEQNKRDWVEKYFPGIPVEVGPYSKDKQNWCKPLDILVDDKRENVTQWLRKGGISVYHTGNWPATLANFEKAIKMDYAACLGALGK